MPNLARAETDGCCSTFQWFLFFSDLRRRVELALVRNNQTGGLSATMLLPLSFMKPTSSVFRSIASLDLTNNNRPLLSFESLQKPVLDLLKLGTSTPPVAPEKITLSIYTLPETPDVPVLVSCSPPSNLSSWRSMSDERLAIPLCGKSCKGGCSS